MLRILTIRPSAMRQSGHLLLVHGFSGRPEKTFGMLPAFLAGHPELKRWSISCLGYETVLAPDFTGVWSGDPELEVLAAMLAETAEEKFPAGKIAFVAHSMGGLICQRALLLSQRLARRASHLLTFGTPHWGLKKASLTRLFKKQIRDMAPEMPFMKRLVFDRKNVLLETRGRPLIFLSVAGARDEFVPLRSSHGALPEECLRIIPGNHLSIVKPDQYDSPTVATIVNAIHSSPRSMMEEPLPIPNPENPRSLVAFAKARFELRGDLDGALRYLEQYVGLNPFVPAAMAGLLKRRWLSESADQESPHGAAALSRYGDALESAVSQDGRTWHNAAAYASINQAFMTLALRPVDGRSRALALAERASEHIGLATTRNVWAGVILAEVLLHQGKLEEALHQYREALVSLEDNQSETALRQAVWTCRLLRDDVGAQRLAALIRT